MIELKRITSGNNRYYDYMERLLTTSFPVEEYRDLKELREHADHTTGFYCNVILENTTPIGLLNYWELGDFYYVEHFAIDPNQRNGGHGRRILEYLSGFLKKPVVLEVEHPTEEMARRRIHFYQRQGYTLWEKEYFQPPYRKGYNELPMYLMVQGGLSEKDFDAVKEHIHRVVYNT